MKQEFDGMISKRELQVLNSLLLGKILRSSTVIYRDKKAIFFLIVSIFFSNYVKY